MCVCTYIASAVSQSAETERERESGARLGRDRESERHTKTHSHRHIINDSTLERFETTAIVIHRNDDDDKSRSGKTWGHSK